MGLPTIRINYAVPFPTRVLGVGALTVTKTNGVWRIQEDFTRLVQVVPAASDYPNMIFVTYNVVTRLYQTVSLQTLQGSGSGSAVGTDVNFAMSPYTPLAADTLLYVDTSGGSVIINLALAAARGGLPISVKDVTGNADTNNIMINRSGGELIDGLTQYPIASAYGGVRLNPRTGSYTVAP